MKSFTTSDLLTTCGKHEERLEFVTREVEGNAHTFVQRLNALMSLFGKERTLSSGFRDKESNKAAGGAKFSWHMLGLAADIEDKDRELSKFILSDESHLRKCGLYAEHPDKTPTWVHVQSETPRSGRRIFFP